MSSATKPRKLAAFDGDAPWPTSAMIGPWLTGSSSGGRRVERGAGVRRRAQRAVGRAAEAGRVRGRDQVLELVGVPIARGDRAGERSGGVDVVPNGDRQEVADGLHPGATADPVRPEPDDASERVAHVALDRDADLATGDEDAAREVLGLAHVAGLVFGRRRDHAGRPGRAADEVARQDVASLGFCVGVRSRPG